MTTPPPFDDATDEAVSALLDGELDDFAATHGTTADDARRELETWPGFEMRRRELEAARDALATDDADLDPFDRRRLVRGAVAAGPPPRRHHAGRIVAVAAAVAVVLGAAGFGLSRLAGGGSSSDASKSASGTATVAGAYVGDVGEVSDTTVLRGLIERQQAGLPVHTSDELAPPSSLDRASAASPPTASTTASTTTTPAEADRARADATRCARAVAGRDRVTFLATATDRGRAAVVVGVRRGARTVAFVLDRGTCALITAASL